MTDHITTLAVMQSQYSHIRQSDAEWEAIEAAKDALDQVATLQAENSEKAKEITRVVNEQLKLMDRARRVEAALSRVEAERDAAISDIKRCCDICMWYQADSGGAVRRCRRGYEPSACMECVNWEWRGAQGEA